MKDYALADADGHYYEPDDCFSRHMEAAYEDVAVRVVRQAADDVGAVLVGDEPLQLHPTHLADATWEPGAARGSVYGDETVRATSDVVRSGDIPASVTAAARIAALDEWGIECNVIYPTLALMVWPELVARGPDALYANLRSFNRWIEDDWGYGANGRTLAAAMIVLVEPEAAEAEAARVIEAGARVISLVPTSARIGALPGDLRFDRVWARIAEAGLPVGIHTCPVAYADMYSPPGAFTSIRELTPFQQLLDGERKIQDTLASIIFGDVFGRHPELRVMSVELGSRWVEYLMGSMDRAANRSGRAWQADGSHELPSEVFRRHVWVEPFETDDLVRLAEVIGVDHILFGSDYPHPEGLENPLQFVDAVAGFSEEDQRRILRDNLLDLLGSPA